MDLAEIDSSAAPLLNASPLLRAVLVAYLVLVPVVSVWSGEIGGHDLARIAQLPLFLACALIWTWDGGRPISPAPTPTRAAPGAAVVALAVLSVAIAPVPAMATRELTVFAGLACVALCVRQDPSTLRSLAWVTAAAGALYVALVAVTLAMALASGQTPHRPSLFVGYDNYRLYNHVQTVSIPMGLLAARTLPRGSPGRYLGLLSLTGGLFLLIVAAGRATALGLLCGALGVALVAGRRAVPLLRTMATASAVALVLFVGLFVAPAWQADAQSSLIDYQTERLASSQSRGYLWVTALDLVERRPWLGVGPMHYAHHPNEKAAHPHNLYLQLAAEWGLPLTLIVVSAGSFALVRMARTLRRQREQGEVDTGACLLMACLAVASDAMFSGNLVMPVSQVWIAVLWGWALCWTDLHDRRPAGASDRDRLRRGLGLAAVALQIWLIFTVWPEMTDLPRHLQTMTKQHPTERLQPRFWSQGRF